MNIQNLNRESPIPLHTIAHKARDLMGINDGIIFPNGKVFFIHMDTDQCIVKSRVTLSLLINI